ncbi:integral membrane sensor signal transduction histidine kinase [Streptomyces glaucescens]|uniref:Integral membrane sensor signal transduction histidine kinase n=1 Tax=Streptomyces glaucescens TaxID=1907 RepID=A0A089XK52_STRGA|nr:integral membrane sensor signal transduction histidine kinase [Streptomyces glaucescens]
MKRYDSTLAAGSLCARLAHDGTRRAGRWHPGSNFRWRSRGAGLRNLGRTVNIAPAPTPTTRALAWCLHLLVIGLLALAAGRAVADDRPHTGWIVTASAACGLVYAVGPAVPGVRRSRQAAALWLAVVGACWLVLLAFTPDAAWVAFPLYFLQLHLLRRPIGLAAVTATAAAAIAGFAVHTGAFSPAMAIGPALGAAVAVAVVWGYRALYRESEQRRQLIEELTATRADLAQAQHTAGVLAERERLAREIHDTLAQGLSSIQLLLRAAERALPGRPETAARHVDAARQAAVDNLAEARRFVAALTPPTLEGTTLAGALERLCTTTSARHLLTARFHLTGVPAPLATAHEVALLRIAQSALPTLSSTPTPPTPRSPSATLATASPSTSWTTDTASPPSGCPMYPTPRRVVSACGPCVPVSMPSAAP